VNPGSVSQDPIFTSNKLPPGDVGYPGGIFNPLNFPVNKESKDKELANGTRRMKALVWVPGSGGRIDPACAVYCAVFARFLNEFRRLAVVFIYLRINEWFNRNLIFLCSTLQEDSPCSLSWVTLLNHMSPARVPLTTF
jgi:hypothetical protein